MSASVRLRIVIGLIIAGYLGLAVTQDGPVQVWLFVLAPIAFLAVAVALHITETSEAAKARTD